MKKFVALFCATAMLATFATGCKSNNNLKVATNAEFAPWESLDKEGNVIGADADIIQAVAEKMGMTVEFKNMEFDGVVASIPSGTCDIAISGLTINPGRLKSVDFSTPYHIGAAQILITKKDDTVFTGKTKEELDEQLKGKRIGVCTGFTGASYANGNEEWGFKKIENAKVSTFENVGLAIQDMKNGNIDVIIMDDTVAKKAVATEENKNDIKTVDVELTVEKYAIAIKKGNTELTEKINKALDELIKAGEIEKILKKWECI